ncbi:hypothetical protein HBH56_104120 [Parastagonospora nodorum]|uniref:Uncharacterized protein n=1 Tax=Phaeosphaeria nodorum (strain SN15 / ATCC MYA-4574 / FGSC 10173) TaxID=321614 RepID=A0A7U2FG62_PHANO|nr:hypothetical protein HBH56_104120 [Parastagonospora nodorum]QRD04664.1 hypothetical protein JI435_307140 [Parastagonospora nodorum SN15]KAH3929631.1 hypothetical protein HBH54_126290 [Parastagonospora nodorum]KAH3978498.1 hypothetical protein HBH51_063480 [Parastagonospora nodorum]KAH4049314.1 hypothetical protein HBH49_144980 [Parastagonospora nodorum]
MPGEVRIHRFLSKSGDGNGPEMETSIAEKPVANLQQEQTAREKHRPGVLRQRQRVVTFSEFLHRTSSTMDENKHLADGSLLDGSGVVLSLERQVNDLDASTSALRNDLRTALAALDQLEWIIRAANKNAFQIYSIHLTLRLRLLTMVRSRQRRADRPGRAPFYMHIPLLEAHIAQLQAFDEVLFAPGTNTTSEQIRKSLSEQVHQHPVQQYLTRRAWLQTARNITNASQQASSKLKIRHHLTYAGESKARRSPQPKIRFQRLRQRPANRARIRRHYASRLRVKKYASIRPRQRNSSRRRISTPPHKRAKKELLQTVSSWLGGATSVSKMAGAATRAGRSRPFGSKVFGSGGGEDGEKGGGDEGKN